MNRGLYIISLMFFYAHATLTDVPASVLFAWEDRVIKNKKGQEFRWTKEATRDYWDRISAAGELRFAHMRDMVLADCTQPTARYHKVATRQLTKPIRSLSWSKSGTLAVYTADVHIGGQITLYNEWLDRILGASGDTLRFGNRLFSSQIAWNLDEDKLAILRGPFATNGSIVLSTFSVPSMSEMNQLDLVAGDFITGGALAWITDDRRAIEYAKNHIGILDIATNQIGLVIAGLSRSMERGSFLSKVNGKGLLAQIKQSIQGRSRICLYDVGTNACIMLTSIENGHYRYIEWGADDNSLELGAEDGTLVSVNVLTGKLTKKRKLPLDPYTYAMAQGSYAKIAVGYGSSSRRVDIWQDANHTLKQYFERDVMSRIRGKELSFNQVYAQMVMTKLFFDLKQKGKALKIPEVVAEINRRAGQDVTSAQELAEIRDTFPHPEQRALQKVFNISKE